MIEHCAKTEKGEHLLDRLRLAGDTLVDIDKDWWDKFAKDNRTDFIAKAEQLLHCVAFAKGVVEDTLNAA